jgi:hypothetical protein
MWRYVISFKLMSFYPQGISPTVSILEEDGLGLQQVWTLWRIEKSPALVRHRFLGYPASSLVSAPAELSRHISSFLIFFFVIT